MAPLTVQQLAQLALQHHQAGKLDEAEKLYRQVISLSPNSAETYINLGVALKARGQPAEAIALYRQGIALRADFPEAHNNLGNALKEMGQWAEAIAAYRRVVALRPESAESYINLGNTLRDAGQLDEAQDVFRRAITLKGDFAQAYLNLGNVLKDRGKLDEAISAFRQALALKPNFIEAHDNLIYTIHFHSGYDAQTIARECRQWNVQHADPLEKLIRPHLNNRDPDRRLRVGYVSPDFREHPVGRFLLPLLAHHDKQKVEVFAYAQVFAPDATTQRLRSFVDVWRNIAGIPDEKLAELIRSDQIDILVDLTMHMGQNRLLVFARKPAPVQLTYLAYCSSTGLATMDYRLSDPYLDPPGQDESIYTEETIRLPQSYWCYDPGTVTPKIDTLPALKQEFVTFGCLNNFCKMSDAALQAWGEILQGAANSQLLLHSQEGSHRQRVRDRLKQQGIEPNRVRFEKLLPMKKYFELYGQIDIALDTFPYAGGTTTCDAIWMGVPVVSLSGKTGVGRGGMSILSNIGLPELVARDPEEYVRLATDLAHDLPRLSQLRETLRQRIKESVLMDAPRFARGIETIYREAWRRWCAPEPGAPHGE